LGLKNAGQKEAREGARMFVRSCRFVGRMVKVTFQCDEQIARGKSPKGWETTVPWGTLGEATIRTLYKPPPPPGARQGEVKRLNKTEEQDAAPFQTSDDPSRWSFRWRMVDRC
jgi:hypothetical protein